MKLFLFLAVLLAPPAFADAPSVHGMLIMGSGRIYISHLPMFHSPHDYQAIAEIELPASALTALANSQATHPNDTLYTLVPEEFVLPEMFAHPTPFHADLFHGHFERGGDIIAAGITVTIKKVLFFRKFIPGEAKTKTNYLLFGNSKEAFLAHAITAKPDFDQVLKVRAEIQNENTAERLESKGTLAPGKVTLGNVPIDIQKELYYETGDLAH